MNLSEIILTQEQFGTFMIVLILSYSIYAYFIKILPSNYDIKVNFNEYYLFVILYILFLIFNRIVKTNTEFSQPLTKYLIRKKNMREEPYHIKYINPFVTNLDKVDFNMKLKENKQYIKKILNKLLLRKYVSFENILGYVKNPWEIITLLVGDGTTAPHSNASTSKYIVNNETMTLYPDINDNMYCMNYISQKILVLYRKNILRFKGKIFFIFEKKNKNSSKYYYRDCISKIEIDPSFTGDAITDISTSVNTIIDTRDLRYDRQYVLFEIENTHIKVKIGSNLYDLTAPLKGDSLTNTDHYLSFMELLKNLKEKPNTNYFTGDTSFIDIIVVDIHFIYNQMTILDEEIMTNDDKKDYALNKFYQRQDWIEKRYFNLIKYQFSGRIGKGAGSVMANNLTVKKNGAVNDNSTIKFRKIAGKHTLNRSVGIDSNTITLHLDTNNTSKLDISSTININFEDYIKKYIQGDPEKEANEPVIVKNKDTKSYEDNDLILDKNTISYISFNFLNIKNIKEYRNKMNYIASNILKKYYKEEIKSIDKIKFNVDSLQIIQLDKLLRYNRGKNRLVLDGRVITPRNIGLNYRDIKRLRESYIIFLEKILKYKKTLKENIEQGNYSLNVTNNELLSVVNNNPFNSKSKYLAQVTYIRTITSSAGLVTLTDEDDTNNSTYPDTKITKADYNKTYDDLILQKNVIALQLNIESYKKPKNHPLFVKFGTTMNIEGFSINPDKVYIVHYIRNTSTLKPCLIYLEQSLLETDNDGNTIDLTVPSTITKLTSRINLFDCTNTFRKETIGVSNLIEIDTSDTTNTRFNVVFDNVSLEFKPLFADEGNTSSDNMYIDRPTYVMLNFTKTKDKTNIKHRIYENVLYKVIDIRSTTSNSSARLTLESLINLPSVSGSEEANIYKDVLVSQFINSKNYIENVFFKKVDIPTSERVISSGPSYKFVVELKNQIINISPEITRADIIGNYESTMNKIIDYIYKNEAQKIHYEIPENVGIYKDTSSAVYSYKYKNELYISYEKRNNPVNLFKNYNSEFLCKKLYRGSNYAVNMNSLYYLDSYQEYYNYFMNLFKNTLGLHDEINYQCSEYYKSGSMLSNLKLPVTFNKYVTFSNNYMLYYKTNIKIDDVDPKYLGKHVVINNTVCDNQLLNIQNSNRNNSRLYKTFLKDLVYKHQIGREGFEYSDAKKICERIFTVYDTNCKQKVYKEQSSNKDDYNIEYYKNNKERDNCFTILYNDEKEKNTYQFIAESKMLDPTPDSNFGVADLRAATDKIKAAKNTCETKSEANCNADPNCSYNSNHYDTNLQTTVGKCQSLIDSNMPVILDETDNTIGNIIGTHPGFEVYNYDSSANTFRIDILNRDSGIDTELTATQLNQFTTIAFNKEVNYHPYIDLGTGVTVKTSEITLTSFSGRIINLSSFPKGSIVSFSNTIGPIKKLDASNKILVNYIGTNNNRTFTVNQGIASTTSAPSTTLDSSVPFTLVSTNTVPDNTTMTLYEDNAGNKTIIKTYDLGIKVSVKENGITPEHSDLTFDPNDVVFFDKDIPVSDKDTIFRNTNVKIIPTGNKKFKLYYMNGNPITFTKTTFPDNIKMSKIKIKSLPMLHEISSDSVIYDTNASNYIVTATSLYLSNVELSGLKVYFKNIMLKSSKSIKQIIKILQIKSIDPQEIVNSININNEHYFSFNNDNLQIKDYIEYMKGYKNTENNYKKNVKDIETAGNLRFYPHRLAHLNEIKTSAYYGADWDDIGWINDANPQLYNKSNLVKVKDKKVMWIDKDDENAVNKGVICYGRKLDQEKIGANQKNEMYNFQMEKIEQNIKDIKKYENVSDFNKEIYSRWNL